MAPERLLPAGTRPELAPLSDKERTIQFLKYLSEVARDCFDASFFGDTGPLEIGGLRFSLRTIPPQDLKVIYGETGNGQLCLTTVGRTILRVSQETQQGLVFLAIDGLAGEITRTKTNLRSMPRTTPYQDYQVHETALELDGDFLVLTSQDFPIRDIGQLAEIFSNVLAERPINSLLCQSKKRPNFTSVQLINLEPEKPGRYRRKNRSFAQFAFAEKNGKYSSKFSLVDFLHSRGSLPPLVLLVPYDQKIIGLALNFEDSPKPETLSFVGLKSQRTLIPVWYEPDAFPSQDCSGEALYHLLHLYRTAIWSGYLPLIRGLGKAETNAWFWENVVQPISLSPENLGTTYVRELFTKEFFSVLKQSFAGDPLMALVYFFGGLAEKSADSGKIAIEPRIGFFPQLSSFLQESDRWQRLTKRLAQVKPISGNGWQVFLDFIVEENNGVAYKIEELLMPVFCPNRKIPSYIHQEIAYSLYYLYPRKRRGSRWL